VSTSLVLRYAPVSISLVLKLVRTSIYLVCLAFPSPSRKGMGALFLFLLFSNLLF
jgi:hypothetical protein